MESTTPELVILDTNAVLRFLLNDIPEQAAAAGDIISFHECIIPVEVIAEMVYVMTKYYNLDRQTIANKIEDLIILKDNLVIDGEIVSHSAKLLASTKLDFIDCLLDGYAKIAGISIFTFDKQLIKQLGSGWL